jgi:hypothetical protein
MMRRFNAMPLLSSSVRCCSRSIASGEVARRDLSRAASSLAAVSRELARQEAAFVLAHLLQVGGQFGQVGGALAHLVFQRVAFALQRLLLALAGLAQPVRLAQVQEKGEQAGQCHQADAQPGHGQRTGDLRLPGHQRLVAQRQQVGRLGSDGRHFLAAHVGGQDELPGVVVAGFAQAHAHVHFGQLAHHVVGEGLQARPFRRLVFVELAQRSELVADLLDGGIVGLAIARLARQKVAALAGFRIHDVLDQRVQNQALALGFADFRERAGRLSIARFIDAHQYQRGQHGQAQAQRCRAKCQPALKALSDKQRCQSVNNHHGPGTDA